MQMLDDNEQIDQSSKQFAFFDKDVFKTATESIHTLRAIQNLRCFISLEEIIQDQVVNNVTGRRLTYKIASNKSSQ